jgi:hypothetical protein
MTNANTGGPGAYYQFVQDILDQVAAPVNDPLSGVTTINGTAVQGGTYGWRTAGSGDPPTTLSAGEFNASADSSSDVSEFCTVGQPAVSKLAGQLEDRLGVKLLVRTTRGMTATEAGLNYYERVRRPAR